MAKPLGYGSCRINIRQKSSFVEQGGSRYQSWKPEKPAFVETDWKIDEAWLHGDLEKLLRQPRTGAGKTAYPRLPGYKDLDIDQDGQYVIVPKPSPQKEPDPVEEPPQPIRSAMERIAEVSDQFRQASPVSAPVRRAQGQKITLVVVAIERDEFILRDPETGQAGIPLQKRGPSLEIGASVKVKILEVTNGGRIKRVQSA